MIFQPISSLLLIFALWLSSTLIPDSSARMGETSLYLPVIQHSAGPGGIAAPQLKWQRGGCYSSWCETGWYSSPAVADLDGNGQNEVIGSAYSIVALNGDNGNLIWRVASGHDPSQPGASNAGRTWPGIVIADVDNDQQVEIVTAQGGGYLSVYERDGFFASNPVVVLSCAGWPSQTWMMTAPWRSSPPGRFTTKSIPGFTSTMGSSVLAGRSWAMTAVMLTASSQ
jgi:hypothetical protein